MIKVDLHDGSVKLDLGEWLTIAEIALENLESVGLGSCYLAAKTRAYKEEVKNALRSSNVQAERPY